MKKKLLSCCILVVLLVILFFAFKSTASTTSTKISTNDYELMLPTNWNYETVNETITDVKFNDKSVGEIVVYPQSEYSTSLSSIVSNIYGMHAYVKEDLSNTETSKAQYCVVIGYEAPAASEEAWEDQFHCIYVKDDGTIVDASIEYSVVDADIKKAIENLEIR
jgi:hypothetical protein